MMRNRLITVDKETIFTDLKNFKSIISGYLSHIDVI